MKHVFKSLLVNVPKAEIGKAKKQNECKTATCIIEKDEIVAVDQIIFFNNSAEELEANKWCTEHNMILASIILKNGVIIRNIVAPNMEYFGVILGDVTF